MPPIPWSHIIVLLLGFITAWVIFNIFTLSARASRQEERRERLMREYPLPGKND